MDEKPKRGRPKNGHRVHSIRCSDEEYQLIKSYLKKLRDVSSSVAERPADTERVQQLLIENSNLKTALLLARREVEEQKDKVINLLETAPVKELAAAQSDLAAQEKENESLRQKMAEQELQISLLKAEKEEADRKYQEQIQNLSEQLETAKNKKPFWKFWG